MSAQEVLDFWFKEINSELWFKKNPQFDELVRSKFLTLYQKVQRGEKSSWRETSEGRLAEIIVLDQFPRNMFRNKPEAFASDSLALQLAKDAVSIGADQELEVSMRAFLYMPFMHSEDLEVHHKAVELFSQPGLESNLEFEIKHLKIIERFGRYPHRNQTLGRTSTPEEIEFLKQPYSSF